MSDELCVARTIRKSKITPRPSTPPADDVRAAQTETIIGAPTLPRPIGSIERRYAKTVFGPRPPIDPRRDRPDEPTSRDSDRCSISGCGTRGTRPSCTRVANIRQRPSTTTDTAGHGHASYRLSNGFRSHQCGILMTFAQITDVRRSTDRESVACTTCNDDRTTERYYCSRVID